MATYFMDKKETEKIRHHFPKLDSDIDILREIEKGFENTDNLNVLSVDLSTDYCGKSKYSFPFFDEKVIVEVDWINGQFEQGRFKIEL